jgi:hypothetical protein
MSNPTPELNPDTYLGKLNQDPKYRELVEEEREKLAPTPEKEVDNLGAEIGVIEFCAILLVFILAAIFIVIL